MNRAVHLRSGTAMRKKHLAIIASGLALLVGCAKPEPVVFKNTRTGGSVECKPASCERTDPEGTLFFLTGHVPERVNRCHHQDYVDTCVQDLTEAGWYERLTGDAADECRSHATDPDGNLLSARFSDCMNDMVRRRR
jgi:hypothetical protein